LLLSVTLKVKMSDGKEKNSRNLKENVMKMIYVSSQAIILGSTKRRNVSGCILTDCL